ncbi:MAG: hypothetical protein AB7H90_20700 [Alphaproteobacteria bacterium]
MIAGGGDRVGQSATAKAWLLARIEKKRRPPSADDVNTALGKPCAPERLAA